MKRAWAITKRELVSYFSTPVGYIVLATYALISGIGFTASFVFFTSMTVSPSDFGFSAPPDFEETFFGPYIVFSAMIVMFIGPLITMRLLAEEHNRGTEELLLTHPLRDRDIVFGKYGAALGLLFMMMGIVAVHVVLVHRYVDIEPAVLVSGLATLFLLGAAFLSMGLFLSAVCANQITAAVSTFGAFFVMYLLGTAAIDLPEAAPAPASWPKEVRAPLELAYGFVRAAAVELPLDGHAKEMALGVVRTSDIAYYLLFIAFFLFLTLRAVERRRWSA